MPSILVFAETTDGALSERSARLVAAARDLATPGGSVAAVIAGAAPPSGGVPGADRIYLAETAGLASSETAVAAVLEADRRLHADLILVPNSIAGIDIAAPVALATGRPLAAYCTALALGDGTLTAACDAFGGRAVATVACALPAVAIATLAPAGDAAGTGGTADVISLQLPADRPSRIAVEAARAPAAAAVDIAAAMRIVCVGRGIGEQENISLAAELAEAMGAELAASRPLVDLGWVEKVRQVGKSGRTVKPQIYLGLGVSGATEHLEGMRDSALIIAVNTNPSAPIFEVARWGTTCDVLELLPVLTEKLRAAKP